MKKGFSLLELIFAIVVIGVIASFAIPKYLDTKNDAVASTIQRDLATATTSIQSYYLVEGDIINITDAIQINENNWTIEDETPLKMVFKDGTSDCATLEVNKTDGDIDITIDSNITTGACAALNDLMTSQTINLI